MNEERDLLKRFGNENPFRVPEGYFDSLPQHVMNRIPHNRSRRTIFRWGIAAAVLIGCIGSATLFTHYADVKTSHYAETRESDTYMEDELDYCNIRNLDITNYLTEAE